MKNCRFSGKNTKGHCSKAVRNAYIKKYGGIPAGFVIHHICRNPKCINHSHLVAMPPSEHVRVHRLYNAYHDHLTKLYEERARKELDGILNS